MIGSYKRWKFNYNLDKNKTYYDSVSMPPPAEMLNVDTDRNFAAIKSNIYPQELIVLYANLGIDIQKEVYLVHNARKQPGLHYYSVAHVCFGKVLSGHKRLINDLRRLIGLPTSERAEEINDTCSILIGPTISLPIEPSIDSRTDEVFQIELMVTVPWVLGNLPEPTYG